MGTIFPVKISTSRDGLVKSTEKNEGMKSQEDYPVAENSW